MLCSVLLIYFTNDAQSFSSIPDDSLSSSYSFRFMYGGTGEIYHIYKLGMKTPLYQKPTIFGEQYMKNLELSLMFGFGYRNTNAIFRIGPVSKYMNFTSEGDYGKSDSLELTDRHRFVHYSIELSRIWNYTKLSKNTVLIETIPLIGYEYFKRKYDGEVQDLKTNKKILEVHDKVISKGIVYGGQVGLRYYVQQKEKKNEKGDFILTKKGPYASFSYRNFADIWQLGFEAGWIIAEFTNLGFLADGKFFFRIDEVNGALESRAYKIGLNFDWSFKLIIDNFK
jgi:hypothetical protein